MLFHVDERVDVVLHHAGAVTWHYGDICSFLDLARSSDKYGSPRVLRSALQ